MTDRMMATLFIFSMISVGWLYLERLFTRDRKEVRNTPKVQLNPSMPTELATAELWCSEKPFRCQEPVMLAFKPDRVYKSAHNVLIVEETKTHHRVYPNDIYQLSVAATGLRSISGLPVADYGYVRLVTDAGNRTEFKKVVLLPDCKVVEIYQRRKRILHGEIVPTKSCRTALCRGCAYRAACR